jgi:hypothetical protein
MVGAHARLASCGQHLGRMRKTVMPALLASESVARSRCRALDKHWFSRNSHRREGDG